ncbi:thrombospondin type 3 repeat-containing protein [Zhongshania guokunii]|uniref:Thrombospondin type 3 repeat-containing protein n=1 Tax=Zhongshania guokunii TaxID=641783 RepID=A0ABV3U8L7_9GAMM
MLRQQLALFRAKGFAIALISAAVSACGGGGGGGSPANPSTSIQGAGVKGPLANASINAYAFDANGTDLFGSLLGAGTTNAGAAITGLSIPASHSGAVILEVLADDDTIDITTGSAPTIKRFLTVIDVSDVNSSSVYLSPLTTIAYRLAAQNGDLASAVYSGNADSQLSEAEFLAAFSAASRQTASALGFGMSASVSLNSTAPLINDSVNSIEKQVLAAQYRTAIEAVSAVAKSLVDNATQNNSAITVSGEAMLAALADDLADGSIDGLSKGNAIAAFSDVDNVVGLVTVDPSTLFIPGTKIKVSDIETVLVSEKTITGASSDTAALENGSAKSDPVVARTTPDSDDDGVDDSQDNCPAHINTQQLDLDSDGKGDECDEDRDGDGVNNSDDAFPNDDKESVDTDLDGIGNNADSDDDGDGVADEQDAFPLDKSESQDTDQDGIGNNADTDDDGDGVSDEADAFPLDSTESVDTDNDGTGDSADTDRDGDGVENEFDNCPLTPNEDQLDSDNDNIGDACDDSSDSTIAVWDGFNWDEANWQ